MYVLVIAILLNGEIKVVDSYEQPNAIQCEWVKNHSAVQSTYRELLGDELIIWCKKNPVCKKSHSELSVGVNK
jgi:hypothetical protein